MSQTAVLNEVRSTAVDRVSASFTPTFVASAAYNFAAKATYAGANAYANTHKHGRGGTWSTIG
jgi:hypothetical protein